MLWVLGPLREIAEKAACKVYFGLGYPLPLSLRTPYILGLHRKAIQEYVPKIYPGRLIIYKTTEDRSDPQRWGTFAGGGVEMVEVPGDHISILEDRNVAVWANLLRTHLQRTQSALGRRKDRDQTAEIRDRTSEFGGERPDSRGQKAEVMSRPTRFGTLDM